METYAGWTDRAAGWLAQDRALMTDDGGWRVIVARDDLQIASRPMPGDPNLLFRWRLPALNAAADVVFEGFVRRLLDYHKEWTREFAGGHVVESLGPTARVLYQRFEPGIPGIAARDLCSLEVTEDLARGVKLASFRSVDRLPPAPGFERIDWWGAALCTTRPGGGASDLVYLDRENQGGWFPAFLMNRMMTKYLVIQAESVRRFFSAGGPPELQGVKGKAIPIGRED